MIRIGEEYDPGSRFGNGNHGPRHGANLLRKGFSTAVWNRTAARAEAFRELGADMADSPAEAAAGADVVIDVVTDVAASREVWMGPAGALAAMATGSTAVECATLSVSWIRELHTLVRARGVAFIDCPVTGSKEGAEKGTLTLLTGAEKADLDNARPVLEAISARIFTFGPPGTGTEYKLFNNLLLAAQTMAAAEGIALARCTGLDPNLVAEAMQAGAMASPIVKAKLPAILKQDFSDTQFALRWMLKDLRYGLELAWDLGISLPMAERVCDLYAQAEERGWRSQDYAVVAKLLSENV
jgi:3-hydroxyisobutyrate dehydrogenase